MPTVEVEISVWCAKCGAGLCNQSSGERKHRETGVSVEPCKTCMEAARDSGYDEGYQTAEKKFNTD
jgi:hypothetical protein